MTQESDMLINMCTFELPHAYIESQEHSKRRPFTCRRDNLKHKVGLSSINLIYILTLTLALLTTHVALTLAS